MRLRTRLKDWIAYRRDRRQVRREYRDVRRTQVDHAESERFRGPGTPMGRGHGGGGIGGGGG
jgi:hypothetical protein